MTNYMYYGWEEFDSDMRMLADVISENEQLEYIFGIPRGGLVPAVALSHLTGLKMLYGDQSKTDPYCTVVVDDIMDTGRSMREFLSGYTVMSIHYKRRAVAQPGYFCHMIPDDTWIVYPWEDFSEAEKEFAEFTEKRGL